MSTHEINHEVTGPCPSDRRSGDELTTFLYLNPLTPMGASILEAKATELHDSFQVVALRITIHEEGLITKHYNNSGDSLSPYKEVKTLPPEASAALRLNVGLQIGRSWDRIPELALLSRILFPS